MGLRILRIIIVGALTFIICLPVEAQSEHRKTYETPVKKEYPALNKAGVEPVSPSNIIETSVNATPSIQPIRPDKDSLVFNNQAYPAEKNLAPKLQGYAAQEDNYNQLNGVDFRRQGMFQLADGLSLYANSMMDEHPDLLTTRSMGLGFYGEFDNWDFTAGMEVNRYMSAWPGSFSNHVTNQYGVAASLTYHFNPLWSATLFGAYYSRNPYFNMASFPYVYTSRYGGYLRYDNGKVGMKMGMERNYDAFRRTWQNVPIVTPVWHVSKGFDVELPFGHLVRESFQNIFGHDHRHRFNQVL